MLLDFDNLYSALLDLSSTHLLDHGCAQRQAGGAPGAPLPPFRPTGALALRIP